MYICDPMEMELFKASKSSRRQKSNLEKWTGKEYLLKMAKNSSKDNP